MSGSNSESWDDGSNYEPDLGPVEPTVPLPPDAVNPRPHSGTGPTTPLPPEFGQQSPTPGPTPPPPMPTSGYPVPGPYPSAQPRDGQSVGALVTGVLSLMFVLFCAVLSIPLGIVAIVLGVQARKRGRLTGASTGMATAGMALGIAALVLTVIWAIVAIVLSSAS